MKKKKNYLTYVIILGVVVAAFLVFRSANSGPGQHDELAQCLADNGAVMYSAWWCPHCQNQKKEFGKSFNILDENGAHVECSPGGTRAFSEFCREKGIEATPTWRFADGSELRGRRTLFELAQKTGCEAFFQ